MKTFSADILGSQTNEVTADLEGEETLFLIRPRTKARVIDLRKKLVKEFGKLGEQPSNEDAMAAMYECALVLIKAALVEKLDDEQASILLAMSGGMQGSLAAELAKKWGVSDILAPRGRDLQTELPT